jgi:hypothetical protein
VPVTEPVTMLTDYALAVLCAVLGFSLASRSSRAGGRSVLLWLAAFFTTAAAAVAGGTAHGFRIPLGDSWSILWRVTVLSIAVSAALWIAAGVRSAFRSESPDDASRRRGILWLKRAVVVSLIGLAVLIGRLSIHRHFNQNDLYHVVQMAGLYCLYRAAILLHGLSREPIGDEEAEVEEAVVLGGGRRRPHDREP